MCSFSSDDDETALSGVADTPSEVAPRIANSKDGKTPVCTTLHEEILPQDRAATVCQHKWCYAKQMVLCQDLCARDPDVKESLKMMQKDDPDAHKKCVKTFEGGRDGIAQLKMTKTCNGNFPQDTSKKMAVLAKDKEWHEQGAADHDDSFNGQALPEGCNSSNDMFSLPMKFGKFPMKDDGGPETWWHGELAKFCDEEYTDVCLDKARSLAEQALAKKKDSGHHSSSCQGGRICVEKEWRQRVWRCDGDEGSDSHPSDVFFHLCSRLLALERGANDDEDA